MKINDVSKEQTIIDKHLPEFAELCSFLRWYPDIFWDMHKPDKGMVLEFDDHQRVMMRVNARFQEGYSCCPRGISKTLCHVLMQYHTCVCYAGVTTSLTASTKESAVKIWNKISFPIFIKSIENPLNCWKLLKLTKPQHNDEISISVMVTKVEKNS